MEVTQNHQLGINCAPTVAYSVVEFQLAGCSLTASSGGRESIKT
jgi:hypothetical protein